MKRFALGVAASSVPGRFWKSVFLAEAVAQDAPQDGQLVLSLSDFPSLSSPLGSVRIGVNPVGLDDFPVGNHYPLVINRDGAGVLHVLSSECRHASCVVQTFDLDEQGLFCPCHGSLYAIDGAVLRGPARQPLRRYAFAVLPGDLLQVSIPGLGFRITPALESAAGSKRFRVTFQTEQSATYEIQHRAGVNSAWVGVPFSRTVAGGADQLSLTGTDRPVSVFVDAASDTGFYQVVMRVEEV